VFLTVLQFLQASLVLVLQAAQRALVPRLRAPLLQVFQQLQGQLVPPVRQKPLLFRLELLQREELPLEQILLQVLE
jgi:hypothetical protein